ncbi:MAG: hypothetical protein LBG58_15575 [Planctomycetaceae bacterium]|jgi:hypothetical protein|nr:hypothetical protein [Planctomycetaceae bacterium]
METIKKDFDCVEMKNQIQAKIYEEIKDMNMTERIAYFHIPPEQDPFRNDTNHSLENGITENTGIRSTSIAQIFKIDADK